MVLFACADSAVALAGARLLQGFATGAANAAICAAILDNDRTHGALVNSVTPIAGLGVGALGSGALVAYAPAPEQLVYVVLIAVFALQALLIWWVPETVERRPGALASLVPRITLPKYTRAAFLLITPNNVAMWALLGFYLSLMPSLVGNVIGSNSPLVGGVVVATLTFASAAGIVAVRHWHAMAILVRSSSALIVGVAVTMLGAYLKMFSVIFVGTLIAGFGFGPAFFGSMRTIMPLAEPSERAGLISTIFIVCYLSMSLPTILAGLFVPVLGLVTTTYIYGGGVIVLSIISLTAILISIRRARIGDAHPHHK
jgi:hypothetical protein